MQQNRHKLPKKLNKRLRATVAVITICIIAISLYSIRMVHSVMMNHYVEKLNTRAANIQLEVDKWIDDKLKLIDIYQVLISNLDSADLMYSVPNNKYLKIDYQTHQVDAIYFGLEDGRFSSARDWLPEATYDPRVRPWYISAQKSGTAYIGDTYTDVDTKKAIFTVSMPFETKDGMDGVVALDIYMNTIGQKLKKVISGTDFEAAIIDTQGVVLHYTGDPYLTGQNIEDFQSSKIYALYKRYKGQSTDSRLLEISNKSLTLIDGIDKTPWTFLVFTNDVNALVTAEDDTQQYIVLSGIIICLALVGFLICEKTSKALRFEESRLEVDDLTKVFSRIYMDEKLEVFFDLAAKEKESLAVVLIDVDYFRKYSSKYGKEAADNVLIKISREVMKTIDPRYVLARYGGNVFAIICYQTDQDAASEIAKSIVARASALEIPHEGTPTGYVTVSVGSASVIPNDNISIGRLLHSGFVALMEAKSAGRNTSRP